MEDKEGDDAGNDEDGVNGDFSGQYDAAKDDVNVVEVGGVEGTEADEEDMDDGESDANDSDDGMDQLEHKSGDSADSAAEDKAMSEPHGTSGTADIAAVPMISHVRS